MAAWPAAGAFAIFWAMASTTAAQTGIDLQGLVKTFRTPNGPVRAVRGVDIAIAPGETVALLGPNGAGKSTTIDMLLGLAEPDAGTVSLFGGTPADAIAAGRVGAMLQTGGLLRDLTVRELVSMMAALYPRPLGVDEVLELTGLQSTAAQRTEKLSGGQAQRVRFACALVSNPDLLVLDEPTVAMDVEGATPSGRRCASSPRAGRRSSSPRTTSRRPTTSPTAPC